MKVEGGTSAKNNKTAIDNIVGYLADRNLYLDVMRRVEEDC